MASQKSRSVGLCTLPFYVPQAFDWLGVSLCTEAAARLGGQAVGIAKALLARSCDRADRWISKLRGRAYTHMLVGCMIMRGAAHRAM